MTPLHLAIILNKIDNVVNLLRLRSDQGIGGTCYGQAFSDAHRLARQYRRKDILRMMTEKKPVDASHVLSHEEIFHATSRQHALVQEELWRGAVNRRQHENLKYNRLSDVCYDQLEAFGERL